MTGWPVALGELVPMKEHVLEQRLPPLWPGVKERKETFQGMLLKTKPKNLPLGCIS